MRKLTYVINNVIETASYKEAMEAKEKGYTVTEKMGNVTTELTGKKLLNKVLEKRKEREVVKMFAVFTIAYMTVLICVSFSWYI